MLDKIEKLRALREETTQVEEDLWDSWSEKYNLKEGMEDVIGAIMENIDEFETAESAVTLISEVLRQSQPKSSKHKKHHRKHGESSSSTA